ncbi:hypothetical protein EC968_007832 [Mortierella alpina]|nr:hypothetical protein EC968_007832 [Mortierella alpina]
MTRYKGIFALYELEPVPGFTKGCSIRVIYPSPLARDLFLASSFLIPTIFCAGPAIASGVMHDLGHYEASEILRDIRHVNWICLFYFIPVIAFYYTVKFAMILWANIRLAESSLQVEPKIAFTVEYLLTMSPLRFLVLLMTFTTFGAGAICIVCGTIVLFFLIYKHEILSSEHRVFAIGLSFVWTCLLGVGLFLELGLIAIQSFRKKRQEQRRKLFVGLDNSSGQKSPVPYDYKMAPYSSGTRHFETASTDSRAALDPGLHKFHGRNLETQLEVPVTPAPAKVREAGSEKYPGCLRCRTHAPLVLYQRV